MPWEMSCDQVTEDKRCKTYLQQDDVDMNGLRDLGDQLKEKLGEGVIFVRVRCRRKVNLMAMATEGSQVKVPSLCSLCRRRDAAVRIWLRPEGKNPAGVKDALAKSIQKC